MPFIRDIAVTEFTATTSASGVANMPVHEVNDILLVFQQKDAAAVPTQTGANYTALQSGTSAGAGGGVWWRRAASTAEPAWASTWTADSSVMVVVSIGGAHTTNAPTSVRNAADGTTIPYTSTGTLNTPAVNSLIITSWHADNSAGPTPWPTDLQVLYAGDSGEAGLGIGWTFEPTSAVTCTGKRFYAGTADDGRAITVCIQDDGNNSIVQAYVDPTSTAPTFLTPLGGTALAVSGRSWSLPATVTRPLMGYDFSIAWNMTSGAVYTNITTALNNTTTADVTPDNSVGGAIFFGYASVFQQMALTISTAGSGGTYVWEYWNGSAWTTLSDITTGTAADLVFTATGTKIYRWTPPASWASTAVNGTTAYYIRRRCTVASTPTASVLSYGAVNGMGVLYDAVTATVDSGVNPYHASNALSGPATLPNITDQAGNEYLSGTALDLDPGYILTQGQYVAPRDGIDCGLFKNHKGVTLAVFDTSNNYRAWTVAAKDARDSNYVDKIVIGIQPAQTTPTYWAAQNVSGSFNAALIDTLSMTGSSAYGALAFQFSQLLLVNGTVIVSGGTSSVPIEFDDITKALVDGCGLFPTVAAAGKAATFYVPLQMGGADSTNISCELSTFQFPTQANEALKYGTWHVDNNVIGIEFYGKTGESRKFLGCTFVSDSSYYWRFNASHSATSVTDFTGSTVVKATVTLQSTVSLDSVSFINCPTFIQNSATLTNSTFKNTKVTSATLGDMDNISNCSFTSTGTGHAIEVSGSASTITFSGNIFTNYAGSNGSTGNEAIYVNIATGTVTINIASGGSTPSIRTAGATVNVVAGAASVKVVAQTTAGTKVDGANVLLFAAAGTTSLPVNASVTINNSNTTTATVTHTAHGMLTDDLVKIKNASNGSYNGVFAITKISDNSYSYTVAQSTVSGMTANATFVFIKGITGNGTGDTAAGTGAIKMTRTFTGTVKAEGWCRKGSAGDDPKYKSASLVGDIDITASAATALAGIMIGDQ